MNWLLDVLLVYMTKCGIWIETSIACLSVVGVVTPQMCRHGEKFDRGDANLGGNVLCVEKLGSGEIEL